MRLACSVVAGFVLVNVFVACASAQEAVRPRWNYQGSAVCPEGYDFYAYNGLCMARGGYGGEPRYGGSYGGGYHGGGFRQDGTRGLGLVP